jgi:hypothetical protein
LLQVFLLSSLMELLISRCFCLPWPLPYLMRPRISARIGLLVWSLFSLGEGSSTLYDLPLDNYSR